MGVAEAWVLGGDQGQLRQAGKNQIVDYRLHIFVCCYYQFCNLHNSYRPIILLRYLSYECAVREGADDGPAECRNGHWGGLPRIKSCWTLPSQVSKRNGF